MGSLSTYQCELMKALARETLISRIGDNHAQARACLVPIPEKLNCRTSAEQPSEMAAPRTP